MGGRTTAERDDGQGPDAVGSSIDSRYQVEATLGQGGMAVVYRVVDATTGRKLALKRLLARAEEKKQRQVAELFEREFYTLAQLAHPRVVEVYDFGKDDTGPYYTMELLDGGDLRELSPLAWQQACSLLTDICSVLSLLHSRRLVHRDLTPRNIRCTQDFKAKLIDFGAMEPMGPCKQLVGTPSFTAPELIALQSLDARSDLFSLGAALYYALTGRQAYSARTFGELRDAWRSRPRPPSNLVKEIPAELDRLVLSLIELDPMARPVNAAEVMERLSGIAGLQIDEQLLVSRAYLSTPTLVGRDEGVLRLRKHILRVLRGHGGTVMIEGASGVGRTRFLDACALEGKLAGAAVLRADASDARGGNWSAIRVMAGQLLLEFPQLSLNAAEPYAPVLGHVLPGLLERYEPGSVSLQSFEDPQQLRPQVQAALRDWLLKISEKRPVVLAVDDVHRIDEPSAALVALLSGEIAKKRLLLAVTSEIDAPGTSMVALKLLREAGDAIKLRDLREAQTEQLLVSVFGEVPNVRLLCDRLYGVSGGNPSAIMRLAQHLVDKGVLRYQGGAWTIPTRIDSGDLPESLSDALKQRAAGLGDDARQLGQAMALRPEQSFSFEECLTLSEHGQRPRLVGDLNELVSAGVLITDGQNYSLAQQGWVAALGEGLDRELERTFHARLARMFLDRGSDQFRAAVHLIAAGEQERGLEVLVQDAETNQQHLVQNTADFYDYIQSLPDNWLQTYQFAVKLCEKLGRPRRQGFLLRMSLVRFSILSGLDDQTVLHEVIDQLYHDCGLQLYDELGDELQGEARLWKALELTQKRYDESPESQRVLGPEAAIRELANALSYVMGTASNAFDHSLIASMPSLEPLVPLSPALGVLFKVVRACRAMLSARHEYALQDIREFLQRIAEPDRGGLDEMIHRITHFSWVYASGMIEASFGLKSSLDWADEVEQDLLHQVNAWRIREVYYLRQGDVERAEICKKQVELAHIRNSPTQHFGQTTLFPEVLAHGGCDDLVRVKRVIEDIEPVAARFHTWIPILLYARGEFQRVRGDLPSALGLLEEALSLVEPGKHVVWPHAAAVRAVTLMGMGHFQEARDYAAQALATAEEFGMTVDKIRIALPLALAEAHLGEFESAVAHADAAIDKQRQLGTTGFNIGIAYEYRARIAVLMNDQESFKAYAELAAREYRAGNNPVLTAKYEKLMRDARQATLGVSDNLAHAADISQHSEHSQLSRLATLLTDCRGAADRARRALDMLVKQSRSLGGFFYTMQKQGPVLVASSGSQSPLDDMDTRVKEYLEAETAESEEMTRTVADLGGSDAVQSHWVNEQGLDYLPVVLAHDREGGYAITGLVLLVSDPEEEFDVPVELVAVLSKILADTGDVVTVYAD